MKNTITKRNKIWIFILITVIIFFIYVWVYLYFLERHKNIELVVSRYNENLNWLSEQPFKNYSVIVYNKGVNEDFEKPEKLKAIINLPNVGRESHTYLHHIISHYDNLADVTVFLPGSCNLAYKKTRAKNVIENVEKNYNTYFIDKIDNVYEKFKDFKMDDYKSSDQSNKQVNSETNLTMSKYRPFGVWYKTHFGDIKVSKTSYFGIFAIHKRDIWKHSKEYYKELLDELSVSSNPEVGHYYERAWGVIFY